MHYNVMGDEVPQKKGAPMLEQEHIDWYWEDIMMARRRATADIQTARLFAQEVNCEGCRYCDYLLQHETVLGRTASDLILLVDSLHPGMQSEISFPRQFRYDTTFYRGFIAEDGTYLSVYGTLDHDKLWEEYKEKYGSELAYRLIKVSTSYGTGKAQVIFSDRKAGPSERQMKTLKNLMIEAAGELCFRFIYDPNHPH